jgi:hypothetical protein
MTALDCLKVARWRASLVDFVEVGDSHVGRLRINEAEILAAISITSFACHVLKRRANSHSICGFVSLHSTLNSGLYFGPT